jgi:glycosyltransferase involved in cell wall biosynthesis
MKVLVVSQHFWPETFRISEVVQSLRSAGAEVTVLTGKPNYPEGRIFAGYRAGGMQVEDFHGVAVHRVPLIPRAKGTAVRLAANYLSFMFSACVLGPWTLRGRQADAVFVYATSPILQAVAGIVLKWIKRAPLVVWVQDLWPQSLEATGYVRQRWMLKLVELAVRVIYRCSDVVLVQSQAFAGEVKKLAGHDRIAYHPNPGELAFEATDAAKVPPPFTFPQGFNVVFAGNLGTAQALETIVAAAELLKDAPHVRFILVGSGGRSDWLREEVARRGLTNVSLPGRFPPEAMPPILGAASVLLVTLTRSDIFALTVPSKVQAYLAAGKPILAALDGEGARVVEEAGAGASVAAEDAAGLAAAIRRLAALPQAELDAMGARGRAYYRQRFSPKVLTARLLEVLEAARAARLRRSS